MKYQQWNYARWDRAAACRLQAAGYPPLLAAVLCARGLETAAAAAAFLGDGDRLLLDPCLLRDMAPAVKRIAAALDAGERIAVYGDYDVDGITATCLLTHYLQSRGGNVRPYIPDRLEEGYGLNRDALSALRADGVSLVVTVDCGITAVEEVAFARTLGLDVVVTDHHACKDTLPEAQAVVDPHRPDCTYPFSALAGVGVALKLVLALGGPAHQDDLFARYADLAAIGTVADVMELSSENRTIVQAGLEALQRPARPGLQALLREAGLRDKPITSTALGFVLAPRLNAAGRMGRAQLAADLLLTEDAAQGAALASTLCDLNRERQAVEGEIYETCTALLNRDPSLRRRAIVLAGEGWHQGVVGIVASRLAEQYASPVCIISLQDGVGRGSCRSYADFNLFTALESAAHLLLEYGGHALAAGFSIRAEHIDAFRTHMDACVEQFHQGSTPVSALELDLELDDPRLLDLAGVDALAALEPCGAGNPRPLLSMSDAAVTSLTHVGGGKHLKLRLAKGGCGFDAIFFSATAGQCRVSPGDRVDVAFYPQVNEFRGNRTVQLLLVDLTHTPTRAQADLALYHRMLAGDPLSPREAAQLLPNRTDFVAVWRYLTHHGAEGPLESTPHQLASTLSRSCGRREVFARALVCLEVLDERGLIRLNRRADRLCITVPPTQGKTELDDSPILQRLRALAAQSF